MPMTRKYQAFEVRALVQAAEGAASPLSGAPAHSRVLHALAIHGGEGTTGDQMLDRTHKRSGESNNQFKKRSVSRTSAFKNLLQQTDAVCQALNSDVGQAALQAFDRIPNIPGNSIRATIEFGPLREIGFLPGSGSGAMKTVAKADDTVSQGGAVGIRLIIDRHRDKANGFHIQTCMPLDALVQSRYQVVHGDVTLANG